MGGAAAAVGLVARKQRIEEVIRRFSLPAAPFLGFSANNACERWRSRPLACGLVE
jgi:hypothetical protein